MRTFDVGGEPLECFYHHIFTTDTTIIAMIDELGLGDRLVWKDSKVGFFRDGKIWPFVTPMDLLNFKPLPLIDRVRLGLAGLYLRRQDDWHRYEEITAWEWLRKYVGKKGLDVVWGPLLRGKFADQAEEVAMAWLWSKIHLRFASRETGVGQKERLGYLHGQLRHAASTSSRAACGPRAPRSRRRRRSRKILVEDGVASRAHAAGRPQCRRRRRHRLCAVGALPADGAGPRRRVRAPGLGGALAVRRCATCCR